MTERPVIIFATAVVALGALVLATTGSVRLPGNDQGYAPVQPIPFSHRLHAGELQIDCLYCHGGAEVGPSAGIPATSICMNCHAAVSAGRDAVDAEARAAAMENRAPRRIVSEPIRALYATFGVDDEARPIPGVASRPVHWVRVHDLPDFATFDHRAHVARGVACQSCHGPVEAMDRIRQVSTLSMGWCVECHRINTKDGKGAVETGLGHPRVAGHVTTDCSACHY